nr:MAG TPA: hypothetical protein [Caudoviricetes sp.]
MSRGAWRANKKGYVVNEYPLYLGGGYLRDVTHLLFSFIEA